MKKERYALVGFIPELSYYILRDLESKGLEAWSVSRGVTETAIVFQQVELEYVRPVHAAYKVVDNQYNRSHCPDEIGRIYVDSAPAYASVKQL